MARVLNTSTLSVKERIGQDGRPVSLTVSLESDGSTLTNDGGTPPVYTNISAGEVGIDVGRAVYVTSIYATANTKGRISGVIAQDAQNQWIGSSNQDSYEIATNGGGTPPINFDGLILGSGSRVTLTFTPYPESGQTQPDLALHINGIEFTADFNLSALKKLLFAGDSISWSLLGNWRTQDLGYNYSGNRRESSLPFPDYFGDELAAFRLVNALRSKTTPEDIRLVNKGFGGSKLSADQWFSFRSGMYDAPWNLMVMQAGINDATDVQTPLRQLTMGQRIQDMVTKRDASLNNGNPLVFCTPPATDDKYDGLDSRVCLDVRPPLNSESYTSTFDSTSLSTIALGTPSGDRWYQVTGDGSNNLNITGGEADGVYRIDFATDNTLLTGVSNSDPLETNAFVRTLESQQNIGNIANDGLVDIDANTTLFIRCITPDEEYEELERVRLVGSIMADDATEFDAQNSTVNHFITGTNASATEILSPTISGISNSARINTALSSRNIAQFNCALNISGFDLPSSSNANENDLWIRVEGMTNDTVNVSGSISWSDVNGFYKVENYNTDVSGNNITNVQVLLDTRDAAKRQFSQTNSGDTNYGLTISNMSNAANCVVTLATPISGKSVGDTITVRGAEGSQSDPQPNFGDDGNGDFEITAINSPTEIEIDLDSSLFGTYTVDTGKIIEGTISIFNSRSYIAQFEASTENTTDNCSFFANEDNVVGDYTVKVQLKSTTTSPFNLTYNSSTGKVKAICFSVYQQGNVIFMNEVASGDVFPTGKVVGKATTGSPGDGDSTSFYGQSESGKTRIQTVKDVITTTVNAYASSANVSLVDLYDIEDLKSTTETTAGRLAYGSYNYKANTSSSSASRLLINDPIEDPIFKGTGDSGTNERVMGKRLHRSANGHEELFNRMWEVVEDIVIP